MTDRLRVVSFNAYVGQPADQLRLNITRLVRDTMPDHGNLVVNLQEAHRFRGTVPGMRRHAADDHPRPGADMCVQMASTQLTIVRRGVMVIDGPPWTGPHSKVPDNQPPRVFPWLCVARDDETPWYVLDVHRTWTSHGDRNMPSWNAEDRQLELWADRRAVGHPSRPLVIDGDHNGSARDRFPTSVSSLSRRIGATPHLMGVDGPLVRGATCHNRRLVKGYGSDGHHPIVSDLARCPSR